MHLGWFAALAFLLYSAFSASKGLFRMQSEACMHSRPG